MAVIPISKKHFMDDWIEKNFNLDFVKVEWKEKHVAVVTDRKGDSLVVIMPDRVLYADGEPFGSIPSMVDVVD